MLRYGFALSGVVVLFLVLGVRVVFLVRVVALVVAVVDVFALIVVDIFGIRSRADVFVAHVQLLPAPLDLPRYPVSVSQLTLSSTILHASNLAVLSLIPNAADRPPNPSQKS
ncbi:hypothetical protein CONLIGDRAFT_630865 [Coniochaeta ligniaria NRRL 30616]|uniref:Uncharacterized protein n=1 Tax=Coniochaeta ligniaria NRRL 30616 TaxID=1408157 RepID=A0A1J7JM63_9PEZI|nr:hypothetical protein CONLIGDRAFT_630865 [Coniochaeta ligniaria NRRL 30616]